MMLSEAGLLVVLARVSSLPSFFPIFFPLSPQLSIKILTFLDQFLLKFSCRPRKPNHSTTCPHPSETWVKSALSYCHSSKTVIKC